MTSPEGLRDYYVEQIRNKGYVSAPNKFAGHEIDPLFDTYRATLAEVFPDGNRTPFTDQVQAALDVSLPGRQHDSHGFLEQRRIGKPNPYEPDSRLATEDKDTFHFTPQTIHHVESHFGGKRKVPRPLKELLAQSNEIYHAALESVRPIYVALGLDDIMIAPKGSGHENVHLLRVLRYLGKDQPTGVFIGDGELASLHFDRGKFTAAIWESRSGLVGTTGDNPTSNPNLTIEELDAQAERTLLSPIRHHSGYLKFFVGSGYYHLPAEKIESSGRLPMLFHGVTNDSPGEERDAVVLFMNEHTGAKGVGYAKDKHERAFKQMRAHLEAKLKDQGRPVPPAIIGAETIARLARQQAGAKTA